MYQDLFDISRLVNELYAVPIILILANNLLLCIIYTYGATKNLREVGNSELLPYHWALLAYLATFAIIHRPFQITSDQVTADSTSSL